MLRMMTIVSDMLVCPVVLRWSPAAFCSPTSALEFWCDFGTFSRLDKNFLAKFRAALSPESILQLLVCEEFDALRHAACIE